MLHVSSRKIDVSVILTIVGMQSNKHGRHSSWIDTGLHLTICQNSILVEGATETPVSVTLQYPSSLE
jgi:hypothetical protein